MSNSTLSFASTSTFRNSLMAKNLVSYKVQGVYTPPQGPKNYETVLSDSPVKDSPDTLISQSPYGQQLYPLNQFGPQGGYNFNINYNGPPLPVNSNQGEYDPNDTKMDLLNEFFIDAAYLENSYGPIGGFNDMVVVTNIQNNNKSYEPYWNPPSFVPSTYTPYNILLSDNPNGTNGSLSQDSYIAKLGAQTLKKDFKERVDRLIYQNTVGLVNLESLKDPFEAALIASGKEPLVYKNWRITVPENPITAASQFLLRISGAYFPVSPIPGDYFEENTFNGAPTQQTSTALNVVNQLTGGFLGPVLNTRRNPSQIFLANTGNGQRSALFSNLDYNRYQPNLERRIGGIIVDTLSGLINPNNNTLNGGYYVGNKNAEPSTITSPPNQIPVNPFGQQVLAPVYGPSELGILYEGNQNKINFGLAAKSSIDGGGINGQLIWVSPKYKDNRGFKATPGGGAGSIDSEFNLITSDYLKNQSTNISFKKSSILDQTQRLIDSADNVSGISRLKHVGNAINQVSKVFNDGYREITKGSRVLSYRDNTTGSEKGIEYCRVFAKDTPYYTYSDLQKSDGITISGRRFTNSVLDNTYNLNIAPIRGNDSTNIQDNANGVKVAKKYMFSLENLAWRTSNRAGSTYDELPDCEKGPNGGRVMWFPPYNLKFNDTSTANWNSTPFLGRPEPIYTYRDTNRTGSISWQIVVDSPSVMNILIDEQLKGVDKEKVNSVLESFFAGCTKFDIYELAKKYNRIPVSELIQIQEALNNPRLTNEEINGLVRDIPKANQEQNAQNKTTESSLAKDLSSLYDNLSFYFENNSPNTESEDFQTLYNSYTSSTNKSIYFTKSLSSWGGSGINSSFANTDNFFNFIESDYKKITDGSNSLMSKLSEFLKQPANKVTIELEGITSPAGSENSNKQLGNKRVQVIQEFFKNFKIPNTQVDFKNAVTENRLTFKLVSSGEDAIVTPNTQNFNCLEGYTSKGTPTKVNSDMDVNKNIYSIPSMACRTVRITKIIPVENPQSAPTDTKKSATDPEQKPKEINTTNSITVSKPEQTKTTTERLKGLSKKVLRSLLTECNYFDYIKKDTPFIYDSLKEKIKFFNPAFHSMTPEGLNARLTFLNQCVRPGQTIPVIDVNGKPNFNDAVNTSFGAPPILVLRIGDFYHTKIVPKTVSFTYEPLIYDMNPEGIGVQPMIANVTLGFDFIGGHGLAKPIEELQNALSFNYYANTEIYDERATPTEDTSAIDKEVFDAIVQSQGIESPLKNDEKTNGGGKTIGDILITTPIPSGETGVISYEKVMDLFNNQAKEYFGNVFNQSKSVQETYNYGIWQLISQKRIYTKGTLQTFGEITADTPIFGISSKFTPRVDDLFNEMDKDIDSLQDNYLVSELVKTGKYEQYLPNIKTNFKNYVNNLKSELLSTISEKNNNLSKQEINMVQTIRKLNIVADLTDGKIVGESNAFIYNISGTSGSSVTSQQNNTFNEFMADYASVKTSLKNYETFLINQKIITSDYTTPGGFTPVSKIMQESTLSDKRMFMIMARIFENKDKLEKFKSQVIFGDLQNVPKLKKTFDTACDKFKDKVLKELEEEKKFYTKIAQNKDYLNFINKNIYPLQKPRKFDFTTIPDEVKKVSQQTNIQNLYKSININNDTATFDGKIKFDNE